jgi:hypothetical protein
MAAPMRSQIQVITNDFKIKSKNHGVIYTYKVDFIEGLGSGGGGGGLSGEGEVSSIMGHEQISTSLSKMSIGLGANGGLETFQKFRIMNAHKEQLKKIYM